MIQRCIYALLGWVAVASGLGAAGTQEAAAQDAVEPARFHHVRLNVTEPQKSIKFYRDVFGAVPVKYRGKVDALFCERSFLILNQVDVPPNGQLNTGIWHMGWGGVDVKNEFEWWKAKGVDIHTPLSPLPGKDNYYMYISGPDKELIEINTMGHHRFGHVHLFATDVNETTRWYQQHLGLKARMPMGKKPLGDMSTLAGIWMNVLPCDNVAIIVFGKPDVEPAPPWWPDSPLREIQPTDGRPINHIAFSYRQIEPVLERMKAAGVEVVQPIQTDQRLGHNSFQVRGPDGVLVEVVEAKPIPEGVWDE